jgi:DNA-binding GntR family transcriptional regulator
MQLNITGGMRFQTKQEFVYHTLRDAIIRCEIKPGTRLVIEDIAQKLNVSPIPVREALQLLQSERLVESVPHIGATVAQISENSVAEVFTIMEGLEVVSTRVATQKMNADDQVELTGIVNKMDAALESKDQKSWVDLNKQMHDCIARIAGMPMLQEMLQRMLTHWSRLRHYYFEGGLADRIAQAQQEHHEMLKLMISKDYDGLEKFIRKHNQNALVTYKEYLVHRQDN